VNKNNLNERNPTKINKKEYRLRIDSILELKNNFVFIKRYKNI
jgi:hypothetical protein